MNLNLKVEVGIWTIVVSSNDKQKILVLVSTDVLPGFLHG